MYFEPTADGNWTRLTHSVTDNGDLLIFIDNVIIAEISDCAMKTDEEAWELAVEIFEEQFPNYSVNSETGKISKRSVANA